MTPAILSQRIDDAEDAIDDVKSVVDKHIREHSKFEAALKKNVEMTTKIAENTAELVALVSAVIAVSKVTSKGANKLRAFLMWIGPPLGVLGTLAALWAWIKTH